MDTEAPELRDAMEHLIMIKAHMLSLEKTIAFLSDSQLNSYSFVRLRHGTTDLRMVIEELMLLAVSAQKIAGVEITKALQTHYSASKKMKMLERVNPRYFPEAIDLVPSLDPEFTGHFISVSDCHLTREAAKDFYDKSGNLLHASHKVMSEDQFYQHKEDLILFFQLAERLLRTFEIDISGQGLLIAAHINLSGDTRPQIFSARTMTGS